MASGNIAAGVAAMHFDAVSPFLSLTQAGHKKMDVVKMLTELRHDRECIEEAILALERLEHGIAKRRGRPPAWLAKLKTERQIAHKTQPPPPRRVKAKHKPHTVETSERVFSRNSHELNVAKAMENR